MNSNVFNQYGQLPSDMGKFLAGFYNSIRDTNLERKIRVQEAVKKLTKDQTLSAIELQGIVNKKRLLQKNELEKLIIESDYEMRQLEEKLQREANDYIDFLDSVDEMKERLQTNYSSAPKAIFLTIYKRAKKLIYSMWESSNDNDFRLHQTKFLSLLQAAAEDNYALETGNGKKLLPEKTLFEINKR